MISTQRVNVRRRPVGIRLLCALGVLALLSVPALLTVRAEETTAPEGYTLAKDNGTLALYHNAEAQAVAVYDRRSDYTWYSVLPEEKMPEGLTQALREQLSSLFILSYSEINIRSSKLTTDASAALEPEVSVETADNGFRYVFYVHNLNLKLAIEFELDGSELVVTVPSDRIEEGVGTAEQIEDGKPRIQKYIEECRAMAEAMEADPDLPSSYTRKLSDMRKEVDRLESRLNSITDAIGIESTVNDMASSIKKIVAIYAGDSTSPGILVNITTSGLDAAVKRRYAETLSYMTDMTDVTELAVAELKSIRVASMVELLVNSNFGSANDATDGFMLYPDGSGAVTAFKEVHPQYSSFFKRDIYTDDEPNLDWENRKSLLGLTDIMLPVIGVKHGGSAFAAVITGGDADAFVDFRPSGYLMNVNRMGFGFRYRRLVEGAAKMGEFTGSGGTIQYETGRKDFTPEIKYMFLHGEDVGYSEMAVAVRAEYLATDQMKISNQLAGNRALGAVSIQGSQNNPVLMFDNYEVNTSYYQAAEILNDLARHTDIKLMAEMYDWYPDSTLKAAPIGAMGGKSGVTTLTDMAATCDTALFFSYNSAIVSMNSSGYKDNELAVGNNLLILTSSFSKRMLLSPGVMVSKYRSLLPSLDNLGIGGMMLSGPGYFLYYDYKPSAPEQRSGTMARWQEVLTETSETLGSVGTYSGNKYVLNHVDWLMDIPSEATGYVYTDASVPLYQMVVHGSIPYTGKTVNSYYDPEVEKLRAIEFGYVPTFQICYTLPTYSSGFVSVYENIRDEIIELFNEYNENLACVTGAAMTRHSRNGDQAHVVYDNGVEIRINYSKTAIRTDAGNIPAMGYLVTGGKKGDTIEREIAEYAAPGESGGISVPLAVGAGILCVLLISAAVFAYARFRKNHQSDVV